MVDGTGLFDTASTAVNLRHHGKVRSKKMGSQCKESPAACHDHEHLPDSPPGILRAGDKSTDTSQTTNNNRADEGKPYDAFSGVVNKRPSAGKGESDRDSGNDGNPQKQ